jgi:hypothetical protein
LLKIVFFQSEVLEFFTTAIRHGLTLFTLPTVEGLTLVTLPTVEGYGDF